MTDLDMHVIRIENITDHELWLEVCYVYRRNPSLVTEPDRVRIKLKDLHKWALAPDPLSQKVLTLSVGDLHGVQE